MAQHEVLTTDAEIDAALERAKLRPPDIVAQGVTHDAQHRLLLVTLSNGRRLALPMEDVQGLDVECQEVVLIET